MLRPFELLDAVMVENKAPNIDTFSSTRFVVVFHSVFTATVVDVQLHDLFLASRKRLRSLMCYL